MPDEVRFFQLVQNVFELRLDYLRRYFSTNGPASIGERASFSANPYCASSGLLGPVVANEQEGKCQSALSKTCDNHGSYKVRTRLQCHLP